MLSRLSRLLILGLFTLQAASVFAFQPDPAQPAEASKTAAQNLSHDAKTALDLIAKASTALAERQYTKAEKYLKKAKKLAPEMPQTYRLLGDLHTKFSRHAKAKKFYDKATALEQKTNSGN